MVRLINNYNLGHRLAIVERNSTSEFSDSFEHIFITSDSISFSSDGSKMSIDEKTYEYLNGLDTGDIVSINQKGLCYILHSGYKDDTVFFMGGNCNSNCVMCPAGDAERKNDFSGQWKETLKLIEMLPERINYYVVTGGEPTLNKDAFLKVIGAISNKLYDSPGIVLTNGRSFSSKELADSFKRVAPNDIMVAIPIHGSTETLHDAVTRAEGSFRQSLKGIRNLIERNIPVEIRIVVTKMNCDDLLNIAKLIVKYFPSAYRVHFISLEVRGNCIKNKDLVYIDPEQSFQKSRLAIDHLLQNGINVGLYNYPLCNVDRKYWFLYKKSIAGEKAIYDEKCADCTMKDSCGGLFVSTLKTVHPAVYPINN